MSDPAAALRRLEAAFYAAFVQRDLQAMRQIWADAADTVCVHPGGPALRGTDAILRSWADILTNASRPEVRYTELQQVLDGALAVHTVEERIRPAGSAREPTRLIATNIYRLTERGWRLLQHHASLPLVDTESAGQARSLH